MAKPEKKVKARILRDGAIDGVHYKTNQVIELEQAQLETLANDGAFDASHEAVAYAIEHGATIIQHLAD